MVLLMASQGLALEAYNYQAGREQYLSCGEAYAANDETAFVSGLERMMAVHRGLPWAQEARLALALFLSLSAERRDTARRLLRETVLKAMDLPFSRAALFLIGRMYEEEGALGQAAREYEQLAGLPLLLPTLEGIDMRRSSGERFPSYCISTESANRLRRSAAERLLYINQVQPDSVRKLPPFIKTLTATETLLLNLAEVKGDRGEAFYLIRLPGSGAATLACRLRLERSSTYGRFRVEAQPLQPLGAGFYLPRLAVFNTEREVSTLRLSFEQPHTVYALSLAWEDLRPTSFEISADEGGAGGSARPHYAAFLRGLVTGGIVAPFARGVASLRLRYDAERRRFAMLLAAPAAAPLSPAAPANLFVMYSTDGLTWEAPVLLPVSSMRDDLWPDIAFHGGKTHLAWVSSRRGPGMYDLFYGTGEDAVNIGRMRCFGFQPEHLAGMPGWVQVRTHCPVFLYADGIWHLFFMAHGVDASPGKGAPVRLRASSMYQLTLGAPPPEQLPAVLAAISGDLDRYVGRPEPGQPSPFVASDTAIGSLVDARGCLALTWVTDSNIPCVTLREQAGTWRSQRIWLEPLERGGPPVRVRSLSAVNFRNTLQALASVEGEGVVLFAGRDWNALLRVRTLYKETTFPFHTAIEASADPGGKVIAAFAPMGPYSTAVAVEPVAP